MNKYFLNNVAEGKRINKLSTVGDESDFFIFADLAIDDCTDAKFKRRPTIDTVIKHPVFWTVRKKELFFHGMYYLLTGAKPPKLPTFNVGTGNSENKKVVDYMVNKFKTKADNSRKMNYKKLVFFIRNTFVHFREREKKLDEEGYRPNILKSGKTEFIRYVIAGYPNLIPDLFKIYRKYFIKHTIDRGECVYHNYNSYFENLGKQILKTTWRSIADKSPINACDIEGLWYEELKPYVAIELAVKFILQLTGAVCDNDKNLFTSIVNYHMPQMSIQYYDSINHKLSKLKLWNITKPRGKSFQFDVSDYTYESFVLAQTIEIKKPEEAFHGQVYTFSKTDLLNVGINGYYWWSEVKGREIMENNYANVKNKMHSFLMDSNVELTSILKHHTHVILHRSDTEIANNGGSSFESMEPYIAIESAVKHILQYTDIGKKMFTFIVNKYMPQMSIQYYNCINHKVNLEECGITKPTDNSIYQYISDYTCEKRNGTVEIRNPECNNLIYSFNTTDLRTVCRDEYYWWLEFQENGEKKMHSFLMDNNEELGKILKECSNVKLYRSIKKFTTTTDRNSFLDSKIANNGDSSFENHGPYIAIESAVDLYNESIPKLVQKLFTSIVKKHMPKMSIQYYDCINHKVRLEECGVTRPNDNSNSYNISRHIISEKSDGTIEIKDPQNNNLIYSFNTTDLSTVYRDGYYWWIEFEENGKKKMHSFLIDDNKKLDNVLDQSSMVKLYRSTKTFKTTTDWKNFPDIRIADNGDSSFENLEPYIAIELALELYIGNVPKPVKKLFTSIVNEHMPKMSVQYYDCINHKINNRLQDWGIKKPKTCSCRYRIPDCKPDTFNRPIEVNEYDCLFHNPTFFLDKRDAREALTNDYYWWLEVTDEEGNKKMHSFLMDEIANLDDIFMNRGDKTKIKLHRSKTNFGGNDGISSIYQSYLE